MKKENVTIYNESNKLDKHSKGSSYNSAVRGVAFQVQG